MEYGYAHVSTKEQNEERQIIALTQFGLSEKNHLCGQAVRGGFWANAVSATDAQTERRWYACCQEHRPSWAQLWGDFRTMARCYKGKARRNCGAGYAAAGHAVEPRFDRHADRGYHFAVTQLCCADRTQVHLVVIGRGHCGSKSTRCAFWAATQATTWKLPVAVTAMVARRNLCKACCGAIKNYPQDLFPVCEGEHVYISTHDRRAD